MATAAVGLVPSYQAIGIWGGIILTMLRIVQGIGVGGEWGGSVVLAMEWANTNTNRGLIASWPQLGAPAGRAGLLSGTRYELAVGRTVHDMGLANPISAQHWHRRDRALDAPRRAGDAGLSAPDCRQAD